MLLSTDTRDDDRMSTPFAFVYRIHQINDHMLLLKDSFVWSVISSELKSICRFWKRLEKYFAKPFIPFSNSLVRVSACFSFYKYSTR